MVAQHAFNGRAEMPRIGTPRKSADTPFHRGIEIGGRKVDETRIDARFFRHLSKFLEGEASTMVVRQGV